MKDIFDVESKKHIPVDRDLLDSIVKSASSFDLQMLASKVASRFLGSKA